MQISDNAYFHGVAAARAHTVTRIRRQRRETGEPAAAAVVLRPARMPPPLAMERFLESVTDRGQTALLEFGRQDDASKLEILGLLTLALCIVGAWDEFPPYDAAVALLAVVAARVGGRLVGALCALNVLSGISDVVWLATAPTVWGGLVLVLVLLLKGIATLYAVNVGQHHLPAFARPPAAFDEPFPAASGAPLARGLASEDYDALASEAAERRALGDGAAPTATPYHKIGD